MKKMIRPVPVAIACTLAAWLAWEAGAPTTPPTFVSVPTTPSVPQSPPVISATTVGVRSSTNLDHKTEKSGEGLRQTPLKLHFLSRATAEEAAAFLRRLVDQDVALPGSGAAQLAPDGVPLSAALLATYTDALFPRAQAKHLAQGFALTDSMEAALRKLFSAETHAQATGEALAQRWAQEPTAGLRAALETLNNPWFLAATAAYGQQNGDSQMVQEALARLETTPSPITASALVGMARQRTASFVDIADTLHHWAARQSPEPPLTARLQDLLVETAEPDLRALISVAIAGSGDREHAERVLSKLVNSSPSGEQQRIQYALELLRSPP